MKKKLNSKIIRIGVNAEAFLEQDMLVLFGHEVPDELEDYCYIIENHSLNSDINVGDQVYIGEHQYEVTAVGDVVNKNLNDLGHITINFDGSENAEMAGTLYLKGETPHRIDEGSKLEIFA